MIPQRHNHLSADEVLHLMDIFGKCHAEFRAYMHLYSRARNGRVVLEGGVRAWANELRVGEASPKRVLRALVEREMIAVDYHEGGIAEIFLVQPADPSSIAAESPPKSPPDRSAIDRSAAHADPPSIAAPHQDALNDSPDRSLIDPPHTPHKVYLESKQQQQHGDTKPDKGFLTRQLAAAFPRADHKLLAVWQADSFTDEYAAAYKALLGFPTATLADWRKDLAAAERRADIGTPSGLVLAVWARGGRVQPPREKPTPAERTQGGKRRPAESTPEEYAAAWAARDAPPEPALGDAPAEEEPVAIGHTPPHLPPDDSTWGKIARRAIALAPPLAEWLDELQADVAGDLLALTATTDLQALAIQQRFAGYLRRAAAEECGRPMRLHVHVTSHAPLAAAD